MKKLFTNDRFFSVITLISVICELFSIIGIAFSVPDIIRTLLAPAFCTASVIVLYFSYRKHRKNVMKGMLGAFLMALILDIFSVTSDSRLDTICMPIAGFLSILFFINHFVINESRHPSPDNIRHNQLLAVLIVLVNLIWRIGRALDLVGTFDGIACIIGAIGFSLMIFSVVCIESRLDAYRLDREEAGWRKKKAILMTITGNNSRVSFPYPRIFYQ